MYHLSKWNTFSHPVVVSAFSTTTDLVFEQNIPKVFYQSRDSHDVPFRAPRGYDAFVEDFRLIPDRVEVTGRELARSLIRPDLDYLLKQRCPSLVLELAPGCIPQPIQPRDDGSQFLLHR